MIRAYVFDLWSRFFRGEPLDVVEPGLVSRDFAEMATLAVEPEPMVGSFPVVPQVLRPALPATKLEIPEYQRMSEERVKARLAELVAEGASPWDAAWSVFGGAQGAGVVTSGRGPEASLAGATRVPGVRGCREAQKRTESFEEKID